MRRRRKDGAVVEAPERWQLAAELLQSQRLAAIGILAGGIADAIRNPLCASASAAQFLREEPDDPVFRRECLNRILEGIRRASVVIDDLLRFARPSTVAMVPIDLVPIVRRAATLALQEVASNSVRSEFRLPELAVVIRGAAGLLQEAFVHLVRNALAAMPDGGWLRVDVSAAGDAARVCVSDTGQGMSAEEVQRIFEPFYTTQPVGRGTGLGLSIVHSIVRQHCGSIEVESAVGRGSTLRVTLPVLTLQRTDPPS